MKMCTILYVKLYFKGTEARYRTLIFPKNRYPIGPRFTQWNSFDFGRDFVEIFAKIVLLSGCIVTYTERRKMILR